MVDPIPSTHIEHILISSYQSIMIYLEPDHSGKIIYTTHKLLVLTETNILVLSRQMRQGIKIQSPIQDSGKRASIKAFLKIKYFTDKYTINYNLQSNTAKNITHSFD